MGRHNPLFNRPDHEKMIGRILILYGEIEYEASLCLGEYLGSGEHGARVLFSINGESQKISLLDALLRKKFDELGELGRFGNVIGNANWCRQLRNFYAHCHWNDTILMLYALNFEEGVKSKEGELTFRKIPISLTHLIHQTEYMLYVMDQLDWLRLRLAAHRSANPLPAFPKSIPRPSAPFDKAAAHRERDTTKKNSRKQKPEG